MSGSAPRAVLQLSGELNIYRALELKQQLLDALAATDALEISLEGVSEIDSAGLQLLIAVKQAARAEGKTLLLLDHSAAVVEVIELFDLAAFFGDPLLMPCAPS